jgi:hypothetical protein
MTFEILLGHFLCLFSGLLELSRGGFLQACVLLKIGGVYCWGNNDNGELGTGDKTARLIPTSVMGLGAGLKMILYTAQFLQKLALAEGTKRLQA